MLPESKQKARKLRRPPLWQANAKANMIHFANTSPFKLFPLVWTSPRAEGERNRLFFFSPFLYQNTPCQPQGYGVRYREG